MFEILEHLPYIRFIFGLLIVLPSPSLPVPTLPTSPSLVKAASVAEWLNANLSLR